MLYNNKKTKNQKPQQKFKVPYIVCYNSEYSVFRCGVYVRNFWYVGIRIWYSLPPLSIICVLAMCELFNIGY